MRSNQTFFHEYACRFLSDNWQWYRPKMSNRYEKTDSRYTIQPILDTFIRIDVTWNLIYFLFYSLYLLTFANLSNKDGFDGSKCNFFLSRTEQRTYPITRCIHGRFSVLSILFETQMENLAQIRYQWLKSINISMVRYVNEMKSNKSTDWISDHVMLCHCRGHFYIHVHISDNKESMKDRKCYPDIQCEIERESVK